MRAKSKHEEAVKRRVRAGRLLLAGKSPPEVARIVGAPRQTVYRWREVLTVGGIEALRDMSEGGRPARLGVGELSQLYVALLEGATAHGFATPLWTLKRVRLLWIERQFGVRYSEVHVWRLLGQLGFSNQKPDRRDQLEGFVGCGQVDLPLTCRDAVAVQDRHSLLGDHRVVPQFTTQSASAQSGYSEPLSTVALSAVRSHPDAIDGTRHRIMGGGSQ